MDEASENAMRAMDTYGGTLTVLGEMAPIGSDRDGVPLTNIAGQPFDPPLLMEIHRLAWTPPPKEAQP